MCIYMYIFIGYRLCRRPLGLRNWRFDAWMLVFLVVWYWFVWHWGYIWAPLGCIWGPRGRKGGRRSASRNPLLGPSASPLRWSNEGFLQSGMLGCLNAWMLRDLSGLEGFGDARLEGIGDCSCNLARSSSGRGRRIPSIQYMFIHINIINIWLR